MSHYKSEYSGVTSKAGGYNSLGCYQGQSTMAPIRATSTAMVIPTYSSIGYDSLTRGNANAGNSKPYFSINNAYGSGYSNGSSSYSGPSYTMRNYNQCDKNM